MPALDGLAEVRLGELTLIPCRAAMHAGFMPPRRASILISDPSVVDRMSSCGPVDYDRSCTSAANIGVFGSRSSRSNVFAPPLRSQHANCPICSGGFANFSSPLLDCSGDPRVKASSCSSSFEGDHVDYKIRVRLCSQWSDESAGLLSWPGRKWMSSDKDRRRKDIQRRKRALQTGNPLELRLLGLLKKHFGNARARGEWF
jgi:hypothetical protein